MFGTKTVIAAIERLRDQELTTLRQQLECERVKNTFLERQLATAQANVDWLRVLSNTLSNDRQALAAGKGLDLPGPQIEGELRTPAAVAAAAHQVAGDGGGAPAVVGAALAEAPSVDAAMDAYRGHVANFEDVGDERAAELGIAHNEKDGTVEYAL